MRGEIMIGGEHAGRNYDWGVHFGVITVAVDLAEMRGLHSTDFGLGLEEGAGGVELWEWVRGFEYLKGKSR